MKLRTLVVRVVPFALWAAAVWTVSAQSDPYKLIPIPFVIPDKIAHFTEYGCGGLCAFWMLRGLPRFPAWAAAILVCSLWGALDEFHQSFVPQRDSDVKDWAADTAGATAGAVLAGASAFALAKRRAARVQARDCA